MTFFAVDDDVESSPKFEALDALPHARRSAAWEAWTRLGAACQKRGTGSVSGALLSKILWSWTPAHREQAAQDLVAVGLWVALDTGLCFHGWLPPAAQPLSVQARQALRAAARRRRHEVFARSSGRCVYCGDPAAHIDHVVPLVRGGTNAAENLAAACARCNLSKGPKTAAEFAS